MPTLVLHLIAAAALLIPLTPHCRLQALVKAAPTAAPRAATAAAPLPLPIPVVPGAAPAGAWTRERIVEVRASIVWLFGYVLECLAARGEPQC